jgi:hypothetical protein
MPLQERARASRTSERRRSIGALGARTFGSVRPYVVGRCANLRALRVGREIVDVDGGLHRRRRTVDVPRDRDLARLGFVVLRIERPSRHAGVAARGRDGAGSGGAAPARPPHVKVSKAPCANRVAYRSRKRHTVMRWLQTRWSCRQRPDVVTVATASLHRSQRVVDHTMAGSRPLSGA